MLKHAGTSNDGEPLLGLNGHGEETVLRDPSWELELWKMAGQKELEGGNHGHDLTQFAGGGVGRVGRDVDVDGINTLNFLSCPSLSW